MTKGEALTILASSSDADLGDNLLELAAAYWLERGSTPDDIQDMLALILEGDEENTDNGDAES